MVSASTQYSLPLEDNQLPSYKSPLREAQAAETRAKIIDSAIDVFGRRGFAGTSLAKIATGAGVSVETVKLAGTKGALLLAAFDRAFAGEELPGPVHSSGIGRSLLAVPDEELLDGLVAFVVAANSRVARLWPRVLEAATIDADVASRLSRLQASRTEDMIAAIAHLRRRGRCTNPLPDATLADGLSYLLAPEGYVRLVIECGWPEADYRQWLVRAVQRVILEA